MVAQLGYPIKQLPYSDWRALVAADKNSPLWPFLSFLGPTTFTFTADIRARPNLEKALKDLGLPDTSAPGPELLKPYLQFLCS